MLLLFVFGCWLLVVGCNVFGCWFLVDWLVGRLRCLLVGWSIVRCLFCVAVFVVVVVVVVVVIAVVAAAVTVVSRWLLAAGRWLLVVVY